MRILLRLLRPHLRVLALGLVLGLIANAANLAAPLATKRIIDTLGTGDALAGPITLLSCDNFASNGHRLHGMVTEALAWPGASVPAGAIEWVRENVSFPCSMVDRIVPASTADTYATAARELGVTDLAAVAAEPYKQWVIEDVFPGGRPAWERAGAVLTTDAGPWERLKLRALNGVHSTLAYLGALAGYETIADALAMPGMQVVLRRLIAEDIASSFEPPDGVSVVAYGDQVLERFANSAIRYRTLQVAMDGSQKLPQRVLHTVAGVRAAGGTPRWSTLVIAAWMRFAAGVAEYPPLVGLAMWLFGVAS